MHYAPLSNLEKLKVSYLINVLWFCTIIPTDMDTYILLSSRKCMAFGMTTVVFKAWDKLSGKARKNRTYATWISFIISSMIRREWLILICFYLHFLVCFRVLWVYMPMWIMHYNCILLTQCSRETRKIVNITFHCSSLAHQENIRFMSGMCMLWSTSLSLCYTIDAVTFSAYWLSEQWLD